MFGDTGPSNATDRKWEGSQQHVADWIVSGRNTPHMKTKFKLICMAIVGLGLLPSVAIPQTDGSAGLRVTLRDYTGRSGDDHWTVVWVTTESGTFIKTLWRQGPSISRSHWRDHCRVWYDAKNGSTAFDGFSSATARNYSGVNSPVILTWDCRDAGDNLVPDGNYKFWIQYAEDSGLGPFTTSGLLWTKGSSALTKTYPNQGANFANMRVTWVPSTPPPVPPTITSAEPTATGIVGVPYEYTSEATGTAPIGFSASGLPLGLVMSEAGTISGIPTATGIFGDRHRRERDAARCHPTFLRDGQPGAGENQHRESGRNQPGHVRQRTVPWFLHRHGQHQPC